MVSFFWHELQLDVAIIHVGLIGLTHVGSSSISPQSFWWAEDIDPSLQDLKFCLLRFTLHQRIHLILGEDVNDSQDLLLLIIPLDVEYILLQDLIEVTCLRES